jgi:hypothetical protein
MQVFFVSPSIFQRNYIDCVVYTAEELIEEKVQSISTRPIQFGHQVWLRINI